MTKETEYLRQDLERINNSLSSIQQKLDAHICCSNKDIRQILVDLAKLKVKSGIWGLIGGSIPILVSLAYMLLKKI